MGLLFNKLYCIVLLYCI